MAVTDTNEPPATSAAIDARLEERFLELAAQWRTDTRFLSSMTQMALHPAYQQILGMGPQVVPLLLRELDRNPDHWFWALTAITGADPIKPEDRGHLRKMSEAWLQWGREHGFAW